MTSAAVDQDTMHAQLAEHYPSEDDYAVVFRILKAVGVTAADVKSEELWNAAQILREARQQPVRPGDQQLCIQTACGSELVAETRRHLVHQGSRAGNGLFTICDIKMPDDMATITPQDPDWNLQMHGTGVRGYDLFTACPVCMNRVRQNRGHYGPYLAEREDLVPTTPVPTPPKTKAVGRNERCPCGSGQKYKRCCGAQPAQRQT